MIDYIKFRVKCRSFTRADYKQYKNAIARARNQAARREPYIEMVGTKGAFACMRVVMADIAADYWFVWVNPSTMSAESTYGHGMLRHRDVAREGENERSGYVSRYYATWDKAEKQRKGQHKRCCSER